MLLSWSCFHHFDPLARQRGVHRAAHGARDGSSRAPSADSSGRASAPPPPPSPRAPPPTRASPSLNCAADRMRFRFLFLSSVAARRWFVCFSPARSPDTPSVLTSSALPRAFRGSTTRRGSIWTTRALSGAPAASAVAEHRPRRLRVAGAHRGRHVRHRREARTRWPGRRGTFSSCLSPNPVVSGFSIAISAFAAAAELGVRSPRPRRARPPGGFRNGDAGARVGGAGSRRRERHTRERALAVGSDPPPRERRRGRRRRAPPGGSACASSEKKGSRLPKTSLPKTSRRRSRAAPPAGAPAASRASGADARRSAGFADCSSSRRLGRPPTPADSVVRAAEHAPGAFARRLAAAAAPADGGGVAAAARRLRSASLSSGGEWTPRSWRSATMAAPSSPPVTKRRARAGVDAVSVVASAPSTPSKSFRRSGTGPTSAAVRGRASAAAAPVERGGLPSGRRANRRFFRRRRKSSNIGDVRRSDAFTSSRAARFSAFVGNGAKNSGVVACALRAEKRAARESAARRPRGGARAEETKKKALLRRHPPVPRTARARWPRSGEREVTPSRDPRVRRFRVRVRVRLRTRRDSRARESRSSRRRCGSTTPRAARCRARRRSSGGRRRTRRTTSACPRPRPRRTCRTSPRPGPARSKGRHRGPRTSGRVSSP